MERENDKEGKIIHVNIIKEKRQLSVRFPAKLVDKFQIDPSNDSFIWVVEGDKEISLKGVLIKRGKNQKNEEKS